METLTLSDAWTLDIPSSAFPRVNATVPGSVYHDLLTAGLIPDPFYRDNENEALKIMDHDFIYSCCFTVPAELLQNDAVVLHCDGLDTLATITINGQLVGTAKAFARSVELMAGADTLLSDNYFDMNAGTTRVKILRGEAKEVSVRSVYDIR